MSGRYIDADALHNLFREWFESYDWDENEIEKHTIATAIRTVDAQPTADVVEVVRCKDCKHYKKNISCVGGLYNGCSEWLNEGNEIEVREDDYCSFGERGEDDKG